jgi:predicted ABC-type sugar transport system permease subunit
LWLHRRFRGPQKIKIEPFVVTLGTLIIGRGLAYIYTTRLDPERHQFRFIGAGYLLGIPVPVIIMMIFFGIAYFIQTSTVFGRRCYAVGGNPDAARMQDQCRFYIFVLVPSWVLLPFRPHQVAWMTTGEPQCRRVQLDAIAAPGWEALPPWRQDH